MIIYIIPGNHDPALSSGSFAVKHQVSIEPEKIAFTEEVLFLFLPYKPKQALAKHWLHIKIDIGKIGCSSHGDYLSAQPFVMITKRAFICPFKKRHRAIPACEDVLGHIHLPYNMDKLFIKVPLRLTSLKPAYGPSDL